MKLKLVVASMSVLGLVSCPAFAAEGQVVKHKHHHVKKHMVTTHEYKGQDYKGALPVVVENCQPGQYAAVLDVMSQNAGRARPTEDCNKLISFAGGINFDGHWGNRNPLYQGENTRLFSLNDAYLNVFGNVGDWVKAFASLSYGTPSGVAAGSVLANGQYSNVYPNVADNSLTLEQAMVRFANFDESPAFVQLGKQFADFGRYTIHPLHRTMTQSLSETLQTSAELGFIVPGGFHGDVYAFSDQLPERSAAATGFTTGSIKTNYGAAIGFDMPNEQLGWGVNVGYLYNMIGVGDVQQAVSQTTNGSATTGGSYFSRVGALAVDAMINSGPFSLIGDYVTSLQRFNVNDLVSTNTARGAKPWAGNIQAAYGYNAWGKNQNLYVGYETSGDAPNLHLPKSRWVVGLNVDVMKNSLIGVEVGHDTDYSVSNTGTGNSSNTIGVRGSVKFG